MAEVMSAYLWRFSAVSGGFAERRSPFSSPLMETNPRQGCLLSGQLGRASIWRNPMGDQKKPDQQKPGYTDQEKKRELERAGQEPQMEHEHEQGTNPARGE